MKKPYLDLQEFVHALESAGELLRIPKPIDPYLEISELYLRHARSKDGGKALLFENVKGSSIPVLINTFGSYKRMALGFGTHTYEDYAKEILGLLDLSVPESFFGKINKGLSMLPILKYPPRKITKAAPCQEIVLTGDQVDLGVLPVMTSWPLDGGPFITLPLVFTRSLDGKKENMGLYRMHVYDRNTTGMHWQTHKDGSHFYSEYRKAKKRMPVAVAIGADPATVYSGTAPLPAGIFELLFAGFLRGTGVPMVPCKTVDLSVPAHSEIILEGYVEPDELRDEGPFGDHTGYYTLREPYPVFHITAITMKKKPIYLSTVVGRSPMEDCYLAHATERLFLPLLQHIAPEVIDQHLPWDGNFHNCQIFTIEKNYPYQGRRLMSHIWGFTQASFCKCIVTASQDAPIHDDAKFIDYFLDHVDFSKNLFITEGIVDALDHSAIHKLFGGKIGIDISHPIEGEPGFQKSSVSTRPATNLEFLDKELAMLDTAIIGCQPYGLHLKNPVLILKIFKKHKPHIGRDLASKIFSKTNLKAFKVFVLVDEKNQDLKDYHKIMWRVFNNTDGLRDVFPQMDRVLIDATYKIAAEGYDREWPDDLEMDHEVCNLIDAEFSDYLP